jgi:hypothetical protein
MLNGKGRKVSTVVYFNLSLLPKHLSANTVDNHRITQTEYFSGSHSGLFAMQSAKKFTDFSDVFAASIIRVMRVAANTSEMSANFWQTARCNESQESHPSSYRAHSQFLDADSNHSPLPPQQQKTVGTKHKSANLNLTIRMLTKLKQ